MKTTQTDVLILGAGITGLVTAFKLKKAGKKVVLLELRNRTGGQMETHSIDGFVLESGPNTGVLNNIHAMELFEELAERIQPETAQEAAKKRLIWKGRSFHALPSGLVSAVTTPLFSFSDKLRICLEPWRAKGTDPMESIAGISTRRLGKTFYQYAVNPFVSGVYAGDPERLVTRYATAKLYNLEQTYGSFVRGSIKLAKLPKTEQQKKVSKKVFSTPGGFGTLVQALTAAVGDENIRLNCGTLQVQPAANGFWSVESLALGERFETANVVSTVPAYSLPELLPFADQNDLTTIAQMPYAPVIQVGVGIRSDEGRTPLAFGGLVPAIEKKDVLGILFPSSCFVNRCPEGGSTLAFFMGGRNHPEMLTMSDEQIESMVRKALTEMLGFSQGYKPDVLRIFRHERAIPQYEADSEARLQAIERIQQAHPGLILAGGIRDGIGLSDRIKQASLIAESVSTAG